VLVVTGGYSGGSLDTTETLDYSTPGSAWTLMTARLPSARRTLRGLTVANIFYVTGGWTSGPIKDVLAWNMMTKAWEEQSPLTIARGNHAVVAAPSVAIADWCN
jgi:hypothetical protein